MRLYVDYRSLNYITVKDRHPLPLIGELLDRFLGVKIFIKLDLRNAYHRLRIRKGDKWKTAFRTRYGHFKYLIMPFRLINALVTFQRYIYRALASLLDDFYVVYLDNILIYLNSLKDHIVHVNSVLQRLIK